MRTVAFGFVVGLACVTVWPATAAAQSAITGVVRDATGAVLVGRHRGGGKRRAHRARPQRRLRRPGCLPDRRFAPWRLRRDFTLTVQHLQARRHHLPSDSLPPSMPR